MRSSISIFALLSCLLSIPVDSSAGDEGIPYISPGFGFSWNFGSGFVFTPKLSLGYVGEYGFVNLTVAAATCLSESPHSLYIIETQFGTGCGTRDIPLVGGGGIGAAFQKTEEGVKVYPTGTAFIGFFLFAKVDIVLREKTRIDAGTEIVFPIPLKRIRIG